MSHSLDKRIAAIRRGAKTILVVHGVCWIVGSTISVALLFALLDYAIRIEDTGVRVIGTLLCLTTFAAVAYRYLYQGLRRRFSDVSIARRIEQHFPQLRERLSSAVEFVHQDDGDIQAGSASLRRAVVIRAISDTEDLDFSEVLDRRPAVRALIGMAIISLVTLLLALLNPLVARIAVARLANPLGIDAWPRQNDLAFVEPPRRLALGQPFDVELVDRKDSMPGEVRIFYRYQVDDQWQEETELMSPSGQRMMAGKESVTRSFEFRAEGGDDRSMPWHQLEVVEPPRIESLQITLHPPKYTGWTPTRSEKHIRALRGTHVEFVGRSTRQLTSASLKMDGDLKVPAAISSDGLRFSIAASDMKIEKSGAYWFELMDSQELVGGGAARWEIKAIADTPPSVSLEQPAGNLFVTTDAAIPLRVLVKDNLAVRNVRLQYSRSDQSEQGEFEIPLYEGPTQVPIQKGASLTAKVELGESRSFEHRWDLAPLALAPGTLLTVHVLASDYVPQTGHTLVARRITIITADELEDRLAQRQALILSELSRILKMQRDTRGQISSLEIQLTEVGRLVKSDLDNLQAAELNQRQVTRSLTSRTEGVPSHIEALLGHLRDNRVDSPEILRRMQTILTEINRLEKDHLPVIARELTKAVKTSQVDLQTPETSG